jgi:DNA-binding transcriptional MerR regulator/trans-aconitate methyltransferase
MKNYKVSQIANIAKVSKRTIQYYDEKNVLKPTYIDESGYRYYSEDKLLQLQKILALKYLGLSLKDIKTILIDDDKNIVNSLLLQKNLINQKINELNLIHNSIDSLINNYQNEKVVNWDNLIKLTRLLSVNIDIGDYYKNTKNLNVRIQFHKRFSVNKKNWYKWLSEIIKLDKNVLELGCGSGDLWNYYSSKELEKYNITLSDKSKGMLNDTKNNLKEYNLNYNDIDINKLDKKIKYDVIIANHVLYFADDIDKVVKNISDITDVFYCTAYSKNHMVEIRNIVKEFDERIKLTNDKYFEKFDVITAEKVLNKNFKSVEFIKYIDHLQVDEVDALVDYVLSCNGNQNQYLQNRLSEFRRFLANIGTITIKKDVGIFICKN